MTDPADLRFERLGPRSYRIAAVAIDELTRAGLDFVLGGGWAVYAYVPRVPSADCDVYLEGPLPPPVEQALLSKGFHVGPQQEIELLDIDERLEFWAFGDDDLGIPYPGFVVSELLAGSVLKRRLSLEGRAIVAPVPERANLAIIKCCALHNRDLAYRSFHDGTAASLLDPSRLNMLRSLSETYYLAKAAKDLVDIGLLLSDPAEAQRAVKLASRVNVLVPIRQTLPMLAPLVCETAEAIAKRAGAEPPLGIVRKAFGGKA